MDGHRRCGFRRHITTHSSTQRYQMILKHEARRWDTSRSTAAEAANGPAPAKRQGKVAGR